jgi:hypothetical protein
MRLNLVQKVCYDNECNSTTSKHTHTHWEPLRRTRVIPSRLGVATRIMKTDFGRGQRAMAAFDAITTGGTIVTHKRYMQQEVDLLARKAAADLLKVPETEVEVVANADASA